MKGFSDELPYTFESGNTAEFIKDGRSYFGTVFIDDWIYECYGHEMPIWQALVDGQKYNLFYFDRWKIESNE